MGNTKDASKRALKSFFKAISEGSVAKVRKELDDGLDPSVRFDPHDSGRATTPLLHALWARQPEVAALLLDRGADVTAHDRGYGVLHQVEDAKLCKRLLEMGADVNARGDDGATPLHAAASNGHIDVVRLLAEHGADLDARDGENRTAFAVASGVALRAELRTLGAPGLDAVDGKPFPMKKSKSTLAAVDVSSGCIGVDRAGVLWCAGDEGLFRVAGDEVVRFVPKDEDASPAYAGIVGGRGGDVWIATNQGLLRHRDGEFRCFDTESSELHDDHVIMIHADAEGRVYLVGYEEESESKHVAVIDGDAFSLLRPGVDIPGEVQIECLAVARDGALLVGTEEGVYVCRGKKPEHDHLGDKDSAPTVYQIVVLDDRTLYATQSGLIVQPARGKRRLYETDDLVKRVCADGKRLVLGTYCGGVHILEDDELTRVGEDDADVEGIVRTADGTVWVHTDGGLFRLDGDELVATRGDGDDDDGGDGDHDEEEVERVPLPSRPFLAPTDLPSKWAARVEKAALEGISASALLGLVRPAIGFELGAPGQVPVGASKLGGTPDLPADLEWPTYVDDEDALPFLLQVDLAEVAPLDKELLLPRTGMLYVFSDTRPDELEEYAVRYAAVPRSALSRRALPSSLADRKGVTDFIAELPEHPLVTFPVLTLPTLDWLDGRCELGDDDRDTIAELREALRAHARKKPPAHFSQLLGWADTLQGEVSSDEWTLLLQLHPWDAGSKKLQKLAEHWCSDGLIHLFAEREALARGELEIAGSMSYT